MQRLASTRSAEPPPLSLLPLPSRDAWVWFGRGREPLERSTLARLQGCPASPEDANKHLLQLHRHSHHLQTLLTPSVRAHVSRVKMLPFSKRGRPPCWKQRDSQLCQHP